MCHGCSAGTTKVLGVLGADESDQCKRYICHSDCVSSKLSEGTLARFLWSVLVADR